MTNAGIVVRIRCRDLLRLAGRADVRTALSNDKTFNDGVAPRAGLSLSAEDAQTILVAPAAPGYAVEVSLACAERGAHGANSLPEHFADGSVQPACLFIRNRVAG